MFIDRRAFLKGIVGSSLATAGTPAMQLPSLNVAGSTSIPAPQASGIDHIVVVTMENRSFDHLLGWLPNADGRQAGLRYSDATGNVHSTHWLAAPPAPDYTGCGHPDPDHSYTGARSCYNDGKMDGFLKDASNDGYCLGYYAATDIPFYAALAQSYTVCDNWYASILGPTFPNRMFVWAAQTDRLGNTANLSSLTTIFDRLSRAGVSHRYYFNNVPYLALWGLRYVFSTSLFSTFLSDAASGKLPSVSFVDPTYTILDDGTGNDDLPHADIRNGDAFLAKVFFALANGPKWASTVLIINFDDWGGFFEHVAPPRVIAPNNIDTDLVDGQALLGFRVPAVIASPFTRSANNQPNRVDHSVYDHTAALKLIEWRWGLKPLTARDASLAIGNPAAAFNFESPDSSVPALPQPLPVFAPPCLEGGIFNSSAEPLAKAKTQTANEFAALANSASTREFLQHSHLSSQFQ